MEESEKKQIHSIIKTSLQLKNIVNSYLYFLTLLSENPDSSFIRNKSQLMLPSISNVKNLNDAQIIQENQKYIKVIEKELLVFNELLEIWSKYFEKNSKNVNNYRNPNEFSNINNQKLLHFKYILFKDKIQKNELIFLIFKHIISINKAAIVADSLKNEIINSYLFFRNRNKPDKTNLHDSINDIKTEINNYIEKVLVSDIKFNYISDNLIAIKHYPFEIDIGLPSKENIKPGKYKVIVGVNIAHQKIENQKLILIHKIKALFENRVLSMINLIFEEKRKLNQKDFTFTTQNLFEFIKNFLNYIADYNNILKKKCSLCNKISKYSNTEKSFFPPYYKLYKQNKINLEKDSNSKLSSDKENLFFHEECFKKASNPSL